MLGRKQLRSTRHWHGPSRPQCDRDVAPSQRVDLPLPRERSPLLAIRLCSESHCARRARSPALGEVGAAKQRPVGATPVNVKARCSFSKGCRVFAFVWVADLGRWWAANLEVGRGVRRDRETGKPTPTPTPTRTHTRERERLRKNGDARAGTPTQERATLIRLPFPSSVLASPSAFLRRRGRPRGRPRGRGRGRSRQRHSASPRQLTLALGACMHASRL